MVQLGQQGPLVLGDLWDHRGHQAQKDLLALRARQARLAHLETQDLLGPQDPQVQLETQGQGEIGESQDHQGHQDLLEILGLRVLQDLQVLQDQQGHVVLKVKVEKLVQLVQAVCLHAHTGIKIICHILLL